MEVKSKLVENPSNDLKSECLKITEKVAFFIARSELRLHFKWTKVNQKFQKAKMVQF